MGDEARVYYRYGNRAWRVGPLGRWRVGDVVAIPPAVRFGERFDAAEGRVVRLEPDGMALAIPCDRDYQEFVREEWPLIARESRGVPGRTPTMVRREAVEQWRHGVKAGE